MVSTESIDRSSLKSCSPPPLFEDDVIFSSTDNIKSSLPNDYEVSPNAPAGKESQYYRRRRSSLQTKLDRRRRKNYELGIQPPSDSNLNVAGDEYEGRSASALSSVDLNASEEMDMPNNGSQIIYSTKQKRHSWWNIFVPDKHRSRYYLSGTFKHLGDGLTIAVAGDGGGLLY